MRLQALAASALTALVCLSAAGGPARAESRMSIGPADFAPVLMPGPGQTQVHVPAFRLDRRPVTNGQFLEFVRSQPQWRRDRVARLFADEGYLSHWSAPDALGPSVQADQPVTRVSWFGARAYCAATGSRLPEWNEWELAAAAGEHVADARADTAWRAHILDWYSRPASDPLETVGLEPPNAYGIQDLHGLIWEWVEDYGSLMVSSDSRNQGDPDKLEFCGAGSISAQDRENYPVLMRVAFLSALEGRSTARRLGFRCAEGPAADAMAATPAAAAAAASPATAATAAATATDVATVPAMVPAPASALPGDSLYQLPISLETADGNTVPLSSFRGKPLLVTMFYGSCTSVCPMLTNQLQLLERRLTARARANTRVLMVSFDSDHDTPARLSGFRQQHHIVDSRWIIARTTPDNVRLLAAVLGIRYRQLPDRSFNHSTTIALADREGVIQARASGVQSSDAGLVTAANSLVAGAAANQPDGASEQHQ
jgi:formylglycine-generating enzyme required for sulfatase activity/cytochrome oxidase Cu insertion factor (SCO1/SenC/PrrC family)